jgi:hypothetical protein
MIIFYQILLNFTLRSLHKKYFNERKNYENRKMESNIENLQMNNEKSPKKIIVVKLKNSF